jgi:hypothetical protein
MKKYLYIGLITLIFIISIYILYSICLVRTGVIIFGKEAIVFTPRKWSEIKDLDYNINGRDWVWIGNNKKLSELYKKYSISSSDCISVKIRYINLFLPAQATYVQKSKMPIVYVISIEPIGENGKCDEDIFPSLP